MLLRKELEKLKISAPIRYNGVSKSDPDAFVGNAAIPSWFGVEVLF